MSSKGNASMIIGISMGLETCLILGQVSPNLPYWERNFPTEKCGPGGDWRESILHPGQIIYGQNSAREWESTPSWRRSRSGPMKSSIWRTLESFEVSISLTLRKEFLETIKNALKKLVTSVVPATPYKLVNRNCGSDGSNKIRNKTCMNSGSCWIYETANGKLDAASSCRPCCSTTIWFTNLFPCLKPWRFRQRKQQWIRNGRNVKN